MSPAASPAAAQERSWTRDAARARREPPWFHDKPLGDARSWARSAAVLGLLTGGLAPAVVLYAVGWPDFAPFHVGATTVSGGGLGYLLGHLWFRWGRVLRIHGLGRFAVLAVLTGFAWGALVGAAGPALTWIVGAVGHPGIRPFDEWMAFSSFTSAVAAALTVAWYAPAFAFLQAKRKRTAWLFAAWLPASLFVGVAALLLLGAVFRFVERLL